LKPGARQLPSLTVSISSNLAEGCSRSSKSDYARFVEIATGSVFEVVSQATIGRNQGFLDATDYQQLYLAAEKQSRMLSGLRKSLEVH
jgi:four helix bundle protein